MYAGVSLQCGSAKALEGLRWASANDVRCWVAGEFSQVMGIETYDIAGDGVIRSSNNRAMRSSPGRRCTTSSRESSAGGYAVSAA